MIANSSKTPLRSRMLILLVALLVLPACGTLFGGGASPTEVPPVSGEDPTAVVNPGDPGDGDQVDSPTVTPAAESEDDEVPGTTPGDVLFDESRALNALEAAPLEGVLNLEQYQTIRVDAGLIEGAMDYNVALLNSAGTVLAMLEGRAGRNSVGINEFTAPLAGQYRVRVNPLEGGGIVQMRVIALDQSSGGGPLVAFGEGVPGALSLPNVYHIITFPLVQDQPVNIETVTPDNSALDTYLTVIGPDGTLIGSSDDLDAPENLNAGLLGYLPPVSGEYIAVISNVQGSTGSYQFLVDRVGEVGGGQAPPDVTYNQEYRAAFADGDVLRATVDGNVGDVISVSAFNLSPELDVDIYLISPYDEQIAYSVNDDDRLGNDQVLAQIQLPYSGRYTLQLVPIGYGEASFAINTLAIEDLTGGGLFTADTTTLEGQIDTGDTFHVYQFNGSAGDRVTIRTSSATSEDTSLDLGFVLLSPGGQPLAFADDELTSRDPFLSGFFLPQAGQYTIIVYNQNNVRGTYQITLSR